MLFPVIFPLSNQLARIKYLENLLNEKDNFIILNKELQLRVIQMSLFPSWQLKYAG